MKALIYKIFGMIIIFSLFFCSCDLFNPSENNETDTGNSTIVKANDSNLSDSLRNCYKNDATRLAVHDIQNDSTLCFTLVEIPEVAIENYYNGLIHIYNQSNIPARDSIFNMYNIHTFLNPEMHSLIVGVDSTISWAAAWRNGNRLTGNAQIDSLMIQFDLQFVSYYAWNINPHLVYLSATNPLNLLALGNLFERVNGIIYAEPNGWAGDGNDIESQANEDYINYKFSLGWGDCPAGCIHRHFWEFNVYLSGEVEYIGSYGTPLP